MRIIKLALILIFITASLCGCQSNICISEEPSCSPKEDVPTADYTVVVGERVFSTEEICSGIKDTFNTQLYLRGYAGWYSTEELLHKDIEFELFFKPDERYPEQAFVFAPTIFIEITNLRSTELLKNWEPQFQVFGISITQWGLRSEYCYGAHSSNSIMEFGGYEGWIYLGSHTMRIDEIKKPRYETMDAQWIENTENEIRLYMDRNDFYPIEDYNLEPGNYRIYVKGFFESDMDSVIIFEHENGNQYHGLYYFVHSNSGKHPASLNKVSLVNGVGIESFLIYMEKVKQNAAIGMSYSIGLRS